MQRKKKILLGVTGGLLVLCLVLASFALWTRNFTQAGVNVNTFDCFDIQYVEDSDAINRLNSYPMTDEVGLNTKPYTVIMTNNCPYTVSYAVKLNKMSTTTLLSSLVRVAINDVPFSLATKQKTSTSISGASEAWVVNAGILPGNASKNIETKIWLEENTELENAKNKTFDFKISIEATAGSNSYLASVIMSDNELKETTPDFSQIPDAATTGLFAMDDDDGTSYYFRGNVDNNYVDLGTTYSETVENGPSKGEKMLWRIVRINGDGTIRLVTDDIVSKKVFNATSSGYKYVGYTYDNSAANVQDGTNSTIKDYLENEWYPAVIEASLENLITSSNYCNDTSISYINSNTYFYQGRTRINNYNPTLKCPETAQTYGGKYKLKVGLLSTDEMILAGYLSWNDESSSQSNYLWNSNIFWSLSPSDSTTTYANSFFGNSSDNVNRENVENIYGVRPVINLKADTLITSGNGTASNPFVVSD